MDFLTLATYMLVGSLGLWAFGWIVNTLAPKGETPGVPVSALGCAGIVLSFVVLLFGALAKYLGG